MIQRALVVVTLASHVRLPFSSQISAATGFHLLLSGSQMAAFFLLPAILEKSLLDYKSLQSTPATLQANFMGNAERYVEINLAMVDIQNIFLASSFVAVAAVGFALYYGYKNTNRLREILCWLSCLIFIAFMMSQFSELVWQVSSTLQSLQVPWRFLGIYWLVIAALLSIGVAEVMRANSHLSKILLTLLLCGVLVFNLNNLYQQKDISTLSRPGKVMLYEHTKRLIAQYPQLESKLVAIQQQVEQARIDKMRTLLTEPMAEKWPDIAEFRPAIQATGRIPEPKIGQPFTSLIKGQATIQVLAWKPYSRRIQVVALTPSVFRIRTYDFPAWKLAHKGMTYPKTQGPDGSIQVAIEPGEYDFELSYGWTSAFAFGVALSIASTLTLGWLWIKTVWGFGLA